MKNYVHYKIHCERLLSKMHSVQSNLRHWVRALAPELTPELHKGNNGKVLGMQRNVEFVRRFSVLYLVFKLYAFEARFLIYNFCFPAVIGGSKQYTGAPYFTAMASMYSVCCLHSFLISLLRFQKGFDAVCFEGG